MRIEKINYIKDLQYKSYACKRSLETYPKPLVGAEYDLAVSRYGEFLKEKIKNPLCTELAMRSVLDEHPIVYKKAYKVNQAKLEENEYIKSLLAKIAAREKQQEWSLPLRRALIAEDRIELFMVKPKLKGFKKFLLRLKLML